ncbi:hypothetical protein FYX76_05765 [Escherichia coli]|nr:hypothetical protein [Escherichia coli]
MSDESITDSVKDVVKERLKNPLWGYIALSWCGFNWQNLAVLFMSKSSVTTRIEQITSAENLYLLYLAAPITVGIVLSVISPYLNYGIAWTKRWLERKEREGVKASLLAEYSMQQETAEKKIEALNAEKLAQAKADTDIAKEKEQTDALKRQADELRRELEGIRRDIAINNQTIEGARRLTEDVVEEYWQWVDKAAELIVAIDGFVRVDNSTSIADFKKSISHIVAKDALAASLKTVRERQKEKGLSGNGTLSDAFRLSGGRP